MLPHSSLCLLDTTRLTGHKYIMFISGHTNSLHMKSSYVKYYTMRTLPAKSVPYTCNSTQMLTLNLYKTHNKDVAGYKEVGAHNFSPQLQSLEFIYSLWGTNRLYLSSIKV